MNASSSHVSLSLGLSVSPLVPCHRRAKALEEEYVGDTEVMIGQAQGEGSAVGQSGDAGDAAEEAWVEPNVVSEPTRTDWDGIDAAHDDEAEDLQLDGKVSAREGGAAADGGETDNR